MFIGHRPREVYTAMGRNTPPASTVSFYRQNNMYISFTNIFIGIDQKQRTGYMYAYGSTESVLKLTFSVQFV